MAIRNGLGVELRRERRFGEGKGVSASATRESFFSLLRTASPKGESAARPLLHRGARGNTYASHSNFADAGRCSSGLLRFGRICLWLFVARIGTSGRFTNSRHVRGWHALHKERGNRILVHSRNNNGRRPSRLTTN